MVGYRSCWVGVERLVGVSVRKVCVTFCYIARAVLDNDATTFVGLPDYVIPHVLHNGKKYENMGREVSTVMANNEEGSDSCMYNKNLFFAPIF